MSVEQLLKKIKERRGYLLPYHEFLAKEDPEYLEAFENFIPGTLGRTRALTPKIKEFIVFAIDAALTYEAGLKTHIKRALDLGATKDEILDVLEAASVVRTSALTVGVKALREVLEESKK